MDAFFEHRLSDSPYIEIVWRGHVERDYTPVCPADVRWNLLFAKCQGKMRVTVEGATNHYVTKNQFAGNEFLVIKFKLGVFIPSLLPGNLTNRDALLPEAASRSFWLEGSTWQLPDFENVETFVKRMARQGLLARDPVVSATRTDQALAVSSRTVRRRFITTTGLTPTAIQQIERAQLAASLLGAGVALPDAAYRVGYADQPHMTRSLKRFFGLTPGQIAHMDEGG